MEKVNEGKVYDVDKETTDQVTLEVGKEFTDNKIDDKESFEAFKVACEGQITEKCLADYGTSEDKKLWEDTAKELYLSSKNYIPTEDIERSGELDSKMEESKELKLEDKIVEEKLTENKEIYNKLIEEGISKEDFIKKESFDVASEYNLDSDVSNKICESMFNKLAKTVESKLTEGDTYDKGIFQEIEQAFEAAGLRPSRFIDEGILTKNIGWTVTSPETGKRQQISCDGSWFDEDDEDDELDESKEVKKENVEPENLNLGEDGLPVLDKPYKMSWNEKAERYEITSTHPYDLTDYYFAVSNWDDYTGYWKICSPEGSRVDTVEGFEEAVEALKEFDSQLKPNIDHT